MFKNFRTLGAAFDDGRSWISTFRKVPAATATIAGQWYDYSYASGNPIPNYYAASPLVSSVLESDKGIIVPRMASGQKQYLHRLSVMSSGATASTQPIYLLDYLLYYPFADMDAAGEEQLMTASASLQRYASGVGVQMMVIAQSPTVGGGRFTITYIGSDDAQYTTTSMFCGAAQPSGAVVNAVLGTGGLTPFVPLNAGVKGVKSVVSCNFSVANGVIFADASGEAFFSLTPGAALTGAAYAAGSAGIQIDSSAVLLGALLASGAAEIVFDASGAGYLAVNAASSVGISLSQTGTLTALGLLIGTGQVDLSGAATLTGIGSSAGASAIEITPSGTIFSPIWAIGDTDVLLGITATLTGALWLNGTSDVSIAADGLLSGIGALSGAAWFALRARHFDLSHHQRVYVTSVVESLYVKPIADQIVSVAAQNNLSVLDAIQVVVSKHGTAQLVVQNKRKVSALDKPVSVSAPKQERVVSNPKVYSVAEDKRLVACSESEIEFVFSQLQTLTVGTETNQVFIQHKPRRDALEHS